MFTAVALLLSVAIASADPVINESPYEVVVGRDLAIAGLVGLVSGLPRANANELLTPWCGLECDPMDVGAFDRSTIGNKSPTAGSVSDMTYVGGMALPYVFGALDTAASRPGDGWGGYGTDTVVLLKTLSITLGFSNGVNFLIRRPRPYAYDSQYSDKRRLEGIATLSFYSGHTTAAFSMATAYSRLFMLRHPKSPLVAPMWVFTYGMAGTTGYLRIVAGDHFPTDVLVGAATGIGWGLFIPWTHQIRTKDNGLASRTALEPMYVQGGAGAVLRIH